MPLCWSHYLQMRRYGKILTRTKYTPNEITIDGGIGYIQLYKGEREPAEKVLVDAEDVPLLKQHKWHIARRRGKAYVETYVGRTPIQLHVLLLGKRENFNIDHINGNSLDNRRSNLRHITPAQNILNTHVSNKSGRKGVHWRPARGKWVASITTKNKRIHKQFKTFEEAVEFRKQLEREHYGCTYEEISMIK